MFAKLFGRSGARERVHAAPPATRVYAIGDIHGRADLLRRLHHDIADDGATAGDMRKVVIYLGDFVDRGEASREVIDLLLDEPLDGFEAVHLSGNHEEFMLAFLDDWHVGADWFLNGGDATFYSYGVGHPPAGEREERFRAMQEGLRRNLPARHLDFFRSLALYHVEGDYMFVHAGIRPGRKIEDQERRDLLWIREEFLRSGADHGKCIVHGHTIDTAVVERPNRIGIDTGAYFSGTLTCLVLEGTDRRRLQT